MRNYRHWAAALVAVGAVAAALPARAETVTVRHDVAIGAGSRQNDNWNTWRLFAGQDGYGETRSYLQFDLGPAASGTYVSSATMEGFFLGNYASGTGTFSFYEAAHDGWDESMTWLTQPGYTGPAVAQFNSGTAVAQTYQSWDITALVNQAYLTDRVLSLMLKSDNPSVQYWSYFGDDDGYDGGGGANPFRITYTLANVDSAAAVPLPGAAWGGMALLSGLGVTKRLRRRKNETVDVA